MAGTVTTTYPQPEIALASWAALSGSENGDAAQLTRWPDKTVQAFGTFTSITIQGSNDGVNWATLSDPQGVDLVLTAPGVAVIAENTIHTRPAAVGAGAGATVLIAGVGN